MTLADTLRAWALTGGHLYWSVFAAIFLAVAVWESLQPNRALNVATGRRWGNHALLYTASVLLQTVAIRLLPVGAASVAQRSPIGLLNHSFIPFAFRCVLTVLILDFLQYWIHRTYHAWHPLWRVHEIHHSDPDYDVSTAARFHPLEILPIQAARSVVVLLLAPPPLAVLIAECITLLANLVAHANASFPPGMESVVRRVLITPDLHRLHHSEDPLDYGRNFGQTFSLWDRLFGTYANRTAAASLVTGVRGLNREHHLAVTGLLIRPFRSAK